MTAQPIEFEILAQPDETTCGPTCLHALYRFHGDRRDLHRLIAEITPLDTGGTLAVVLACHALRNGYRATIYSYNVTLFDPTWLAPGTAVDLAAKLRAQMAIKTDAKLRAASEHYLEFLTLGGRVVHAELTPALLRRELERGRPLLTGLSATYLYGCARERGDDYDDVGGEPMGHFVVLVGYDASQDRVMVADPLHDNPGFGAPYYSVTPDRLIASILLGIVTYDANLLVLEPADDSDTTS